MVPMPCVSCAADASIASSSRSPGMKVDTDRRTNAVLVACRAARRLSRRKEKLSGKAHGMLGYFPVKK